MAVLGQAADRPAASAATPWSEGAAFVDGAYRPIGEAKVSVLDWGFSRSDVTYDVVHVWRGAFFRLDDHLDRFEASMQGLRMRLPHDRKGIAEILAGCVRRSGLRDAYVAMVCTRGVPRPGAPRKPSLFENRFIAYAVPWIWVMTPEQQERGAHLVVARTRRIPPESLDPRIKNYHWGDLVAGLFEAEDRGADSAVLLDYDGHVTEGPGFNVFAVLGGEVVGPERGVLEGITRRTVMELCAELGIPCRLGRITPEQLKRADEVFAATTAGGVMPVARVDDAVLSGGRPGPISTRLREAYWRKHEEGWHATPIDYGPVDHGDG